MIIATVVISYLFIYVTAEALYTGKDGERVSEGTVSKCMVVFRLS